MRLKLGNLNRKKLLFKKGMNWPTISALGYLFDRSNTQEEVPFLIGGLTPINVVLSFSMLAKYILPPNLSIPSKRHPFDYFHYMLN